MGGCSSKKSSYIEPSIGSQNIINLICSANNDFILKSIKNSEKVINNEELKKEFYYIRKLIIVSVFLKDLPELFNGNFDKMKLFLHNNRIPLIIYNNIYDYHNKKDNPISKYNIISIDDNEINQIEKLNIIKGYIYDIILI